MTTKFWRNILFHLLNLSGHGSSFFLLERSSNQRGGGGGGNSRTIHLRKIPDSGIKQKVTFAPFLFNNYPGVPRSSPLDPRSKILKRNTGRGPGRGDSEEDGRGAGSGDGEVQGNVLLKEIRDPN